MKTIMLLAAAAALCVAATTTVRAVGAEHVNDTPLTEHWWPSEFGPDAATEAIVARASGGLARTF